ncbi:hypothetical protein O181_113136, partial [Austropuccinia psidii MF-1]|nr:hypothetical protein [Austropuccinia psidii MF-1]
MIADFLTKAVVHRKGGVRTNNSDPVNDLRKSIPTLTEENYPEWRLCISIYLRQKKLLTYCNNPITPALDTAKLTKSESDDLNASNEA